MEDWKTAIDKKAEKQASELRMLFERSLEKAQKTTQDLVEERRVPHRILRESYTL